MAFAIIVVYNTHFLMNWMYLFLDSLNLKNEKLKIFVRIYSYLVCKHKIWQEKETNDQSSTNNEK